MPKLIWQGGQDEFVLGLPASDFETDDAAVVTEALASGVYREDRPAAPAKKSADKPADEEN